MNQILFSPPHDRVRGNGQNQAWDISSEYKEKLFHCETDNVLAQIVQEGRRVSLFGDIQKSFGRDPGKPVLRGLAWAEGLDYIVSRGPFQTQTFFDSVKSALNKS